MDHANEHLISKQAGKALYLLDASVLIHFRGLSSAVGVHPLDVIDGFDDVSYFATSDVVLEVQRSEDIRLFASHMLNGGGFDKSMKWDLFPYQDENGEWRSVQLNKLSGADFGQIVMCQQHPELMLVTNDRKLLKCGQAIIRDRAIGLPGFIDRMTGTAGEDPRWQKIKDFHDGLDVKQVGSRWIVPGLSEPDNADDLGK